MDCNDAQHYVAAWGMFERDRQATRARMTEITEKLLCRDGATNQQQAVLIEAYDSLMEGEGEMTVVLDLSTKTAASIKPS